VGWRLSPVEASSSGSRDSGGVIDHQQMDIKLRLYAVLDQGDHLLDQDQQRDLDLVYVAEYPLTPYENGEFL
jgi:hypothetical protein